MSEWATGPQYGGVEYAQACERMRTCCCVGPAARNSFALIAGTVMTAPSSAATLFTLCPFLPFFLIPTDGMIDDDDHPDDHWWPNRLLSPSE